MFASKPAADLAAMSASLRYVHDAPGDDPVAGFLLSETLCLLTRALERREMIFAAFRGTAMMPSAAARACASMPKRCACLPRGPAARSRNAATWPG